ncbi:hAT dimerization domain, ribonuclease H-like domain protein [Tanacetum coccineum]
MQFTYVLPGWEGSAADGRILRSAMIKENGLKVNKGNLLLMEGYLVVVWTVDVLSGKIPRWLSSDCRILLETHRCRYSGLLELTKCQKGKVSKKPISSSSAERNWSTYFYIHSVKRNRLNNKRADKLVYIHLNIRLLSTFTDSYKEGPLKKWDMNPEITNLEGAASRLEDMQWENLDKE